MAAFGTGGTVSPVEPLRAWARRHTLAVDCLIAAAFFTLGLLSVRVTHDLGAAKAHNYRFAVGVAMMALLTFPLAVRRRVPPVSLICVVLAVLGVTIWGVSDQTLIGTTAFVAIYSVGAYSPRRVANWVRGLCIAVMFGDLLWVLLFREIDIAHSQASLVGAGLLAVGSNLFFFIAAWVIGDVARQSRLRAADLASINADLQAAQGVINQQAVLDERIHIAREVHDVVAHHVSVMGVQAGAARRVMARSPEQASEVLSSIEASSRQAVAELQRLLGFLRSESDLPGTVDAPQPSLSHLDALIEEMNDAGLLVTAETEGVPGPLPPSVDLSAYRVVQEGLTNALKHAGAGTIATVSLRYLPDRLELSLADDGRGRSNGRSDHMDAEPAATSGHGLLGMRERVALHGGRFEAGLRHGSGFEITATFPL